MAVKQFITSVEALGIGAEPEAARPPAGRNAGAHAEDAVLAWAGPVLRSLVAHGTPEVQLSALFGDLERAGGRFDIKTVYVALEEMERRGLIEEVGSAYRITDRGRRLV
jgi:hypothetical protein